jgi:hypothetical protein
MIIIPLILLFVFCMSCFIDVVNDTPDLNNND